MAFNQNLCNDKLEVEFSTFIMVRSWMKTSTVDVNSIKLTIAVNTDNLKSYKVEEPYGQTVVVPDPCDPTKTITIDNVMLNVAKLNGYIGYYVGAELLQSSSNVSLANNNNPTSISLFVTADDICQFDNVDFLLLDPGEDAPTELDVSVEQTNLSFAGENDTHDKIYLVTGKFIISKKTVTP